MADAVLEKIRGEVFRRGLRVAEFCKDYDKRRCGYITLPQFHRALDMCKLEISSAEVDLLAALFGGSDAWGRVNYKDFATTVDAAFTPVGLETAPTAVIASSFVPAAPVAELSTGEEEQATAILAKVRSYVLTRKVLVRPAFEDHEANQNSVMIVQHVTAAQFAQTLSRLAVPVSAAEVAVLAKKFNDRGDGTVNYAQFTAAVDDPAALVDPIAGPPKPFPSTREQEDTYSMADTTAPSADVAGLVRKITVECKSNAVRVHDFFQDYDKLNANSIPYKKFITGLTMALEKTAIHLSSEDLLALGQHFKATTPEVTLTGHPDAAKNAGTVYFHQFFVRWKDFCDTVDSANTVKGLEAKPLGETSLDFGPVRPGQSESGLALAALEKIKRQVSVDGVLVKHFFQDFEANQNSVMIVNHVTRQQFEQCISRLNFALSPTELDVLCKMFGGRQDGTVNYRQFVEYVDPAPPSINPWKTNDNVSAGAPAPAPSATSTAAVAPEAAEVVDALKRACTKYSVRIHEFFQDFDRLRKGIVSRRQFEIALSMAFDGLDCQLSPAQISTLSDGFSTEDGRVRWHDVADAVDAVFTQKGLETMPTGQMTTGLAAVVKAASLSDAEEQLASTATARMKSFLDTRRVQLAPFFQDFAANQNSPMRTHHVTKIQFGQVLSRLGLAVSEPEKAVLVKAYESSDGMFVNYHDFCNELQPPPPHRNPWKSSD